VVANASVHKKESVQRFKFAGRLEFSVGQCVIVYKNFTRMSSSEFEFLIHLNGGKNLEKGHSVQESHFRSRKLDTDATFLGKR
jgi:hypothetical protein